MLYWEHVPLQCCLPPKFLLVLATLAQHPFLRMPQEKFHRLFRNVLQCIYMFCSFGVGISTVQIVFVHDYTSKICTVICSIALVRLLTTKHQFSIAFNFL